MKQLRQRLTFANVVSCIALFVALGGVSYAATQLPKNSVGAKQLVFSFTFYLFVAEYQRVGGYF